VGDSRPANDVAVPHVGDSRATHSADALLALTALGFTKREAERALAAAFGLVMPQAGLEPLLRAALRELR